MERSARQDRKAAERGRKVVRLMLIAPLTVSNGRNFRRMFGILMERMEDGRVGTGEELLIELYLMRINDRRVSTRLLSIRRK